MDKRKICIKFAREVSAILKIAVPTIRFVPVKELRTSTQIAALTPDGILIRNDIGVTPELFFAIAHELRHVYQLENDRSLHDYHTSDSWILTSTTPSRSKLMRMHSRLWSWQSFSESPLNS